MDQDILSIQEAREAVRAASRAQKEFEKFPQEKVDQIVQAMAEAGFAASERLARLAADETQMGRYEDKILKNQFGTKSVWEYIKDMKTVGVLRYDEHGKFYEIGTPMGVVAAIIPTTNPTSTVMYKILISVKGGNAVVVAPHPRAAQCTFEAAKLLWECAERNGAPKGLIGCIEHPSIQGTQELMRLQETAVILATGGPGIVRAAYSSGKPAYGVGSGNVPAFVEKTANVKKAVADIIAGKSFDNGLLCSSEQSLIADVALKSQVLTELKANQAHICSDDEKQKLEKLMFGSGRLNTKVVGHFAYEIANMAGFSVPETTPALIVSCEQAGREEPLSAEKLSPVLALYFVDGWEAGCELAKKILNYGGIGHTMSIHSQDQDVIMKFGLEKPAFRICVNTVATLGAVGYTTGLAPSMTLGPGTIGGSITTDNITPTNLINVKRLAFETQSFTPNPIRPPKAKTGTSDVPVFDSRPKRTQSAPVESKSGTGNYGSEGLSGKQIDKIVQEFIQDRKA